MTSVSGGGASAFAVREARREEFGALADVLAAAYAVYPETDAAYLEELRDIARRALTCTILAAVDEDGTIVGGATYVPGPGPYAESEREGEAGIRMLAVAPDFQGRGIGRALTEACIELARADGKTRIVLLTLPSMTAAHRMYARLGFLRAPGRDWNPSDEFRLLGYELDLA